MASFLKLDLADEDNLVVTPLQAETIEQAIEKAYQEALADDRLCPCHGYTQAECLSKRDDSIQWSPGDGADYTILLVVPDTEEGRAKIDNWLKD